MSGQLRDAARDALRRVRSGESNDLAVNRAVFEVRVDNRTELVTVNLRDGQLFCVTSDGRMEGPEVNSVLRLLSGDALRDAPFGRGSLTPNSTAIDLSREPRDELRGDSRRDPAAAVGSHEFRGACLDLVTAVARVGLDAAATSTSVDAAIERLTMANGVSVPLGLDRFLGRLRRALQTRDAVIATRLLAEAARAGLSANHDNPEERRRLAAFLGGYEDRDLEHITDRKLVEVGREWVPGRNRAGIERRYVVDAKSGTVYREERARGAPGVSVGPCPRFISVGLAEVERGPEPRRLRLLQYSVSAHIHADTWMQINNGAAADFEALARRYRDALREYPGLSEPVTVIRPDRCETDGRIVPFDAQGRAMPIATARDPGAEVALRRITKEGDIAWFAGRLIDIDDQILLVAISVGIHKQGKLAVRRLR